MTPTPTKKKPTAAKTRGATPARTAKAKTTTTKAAATTTATATAKKAKPATVDAAALDIHPLTPARWPDVEALFAMRGCSIARHCWCMAYRRSASEQPPLPPGKTRAQMNREGLHALTQSKQPPGLIAYDKSSKRPVGWVSLGPREDFRRLANSPIMAPVDDQPVWSIICFVVPPEFRGQGVARALLRGAMAYAKKRGVKLLEAYPVDKPGRQNGDNLWFGTLGLYEGEGFEEVARRKATRAVVRIVPG